jgi:hypothetical protein
VSIVSINALYGTLLRPEPPAAVLSASTIRRIHATLHKALADAVRWQLIARNPAAFADPPRAAKPEMNVWSDPIWPPSWSPLAATGWPLCGCSWR